jgi:hypothetical protein
MTSGTRSTQVSHLIFTLLAVIVISAMIVSPVRAGNFTSLNSFIESVTNGEAKVVRGIYIQDLMALPVIQQPTGRPGFVSSNNDQLTQFGMAAEAGNIGLLAHNYLSGSTFPQLKKGDVVVVVYGDGHTEKFLISTILKYQALNPNDVNSEFKDLDTQSTLTADQLFAKVYRGSRHVTFQTCIEKDGNYSWGRLFILAEPIKG